MGWDGGSGGVGGGGGGVSGRVRWVVGFLKVFLRFLYVSVDAEAGLGDESMEVEKCIYIYMRRRRNWPWLKRLRDKNGRVVDHILFSLEVVFFC